MVTSIEDYGVFQVDKYQLKADYERYRLPPLATQGSPLRKQTNNTTGDESNDDPGPFKKLYVKISKWTPPEGEFPAADHYIGLSLLSTHWISIVQSHAGMLITCRNLR